MDLTFPSTIELNLLAAGDYHLPIRGIVIKKEINFFCSSLDFP